MENVSDTHNDFAFSLYNELSLQKGNNLNIVKFYIS